MKAMVQLWSEDNGQDVAEYAVMLAVILVIVIGTVRLIGQRQQRVLASRQHDAITCAIQPRCAWHGASPEFFCRFSPATNNLCAMAGAAVGSWRLACSY